MTFQTTLYLLLGAGLVLVVGGYLFVRARRPKVEPIYHFRCPGCGRRLRYRERQVGHRGKCSHCGNQLTFPPIAQAIDGRETRRPGTRGQ